MATLGVSPTRVRPGQTRTIQFIGSGTAWGTSAPTFTPSGLAGVSGTGLVVASNGLASLSVTYGAAKGVLTWTDSTTGATVNQVVGGRITPLWVPHK
jgi:hypothetical protein